MGDLSITRGYRYCAACRKGVIRFDTWAGLTADSLTPTGRQMAVLAGSRMSFDLASDSLDRLCGIRVSDQTIRRACDQTGQRAQAYLASHAQASQPIAQADGHLEWSTDGAKVNTVDGWREIRGLLACRREAGEPAGVAQWQNRPLPEPSAKLAWAAIATSDEVGSQWRAWCEALDCGVGEGVSVVADGAAWIWKQAGACLPDHEGVLDVYHLLEHLHAAGRALHGEGKAARAWAERQRAAIFRHGVKVYVRDHLAPQVRALDDQADQAAQADALRGLLRYVWSHRSRLNYRDRLRRGRTIGSGQMEGMCKNTLNDRLRKNSPRWHVTSANHMAALRCLHTSNLWDTFWRHDTPRAAA